MQVHRPVILNSADSCSAVSAGAAGHVNLIENVSKKMKKITFCDIVKEKRNTLSGGIIKYDCQNTSL